MLLAFLIVSWPPRTSASNSNDTRRCPPVCPFVRVSHSKIVKTKREREQSLLLNVHRKSGFLPHQIRDRKYSSAILGFFLGGQLSFHPIWDDTLSNNCRVEWLSRVTVKASESDYVTLSAIQYCCALVKVKELYYCDHILLWVYCY